MPSPCSLAAVHWSPAPKQLAPPQSAPHSHHHHDHTRLPFGSHTSTRAQPHKPALRTSFPPPRSGPRGVLPPLTKTKPHTESDQTNQPCPASHRPSGPRRCGTCAGRCTRSRRSSGRSWSAAWARHCCTRCPASAAALATLTRPRYLTATLVSLLFLLFAFAFGRSTGISAGRKGDAERGRGRMNKMDGTCANGLC